MKKALVVLALFIVILVGWFSYLSTSAINGEEELSSVPVITVMDILHARDLQAGVKQAVKANDSEAINGWLEQALSVAKAASLSQHDIDYLSSSQAYDYLVFNAKRQLFNDAFEARYYALEDISDLQTQYPEAKDLYERAEQLIEKRDAIIFQIATALSNNDAPTEIELEEAKKQWLLRAQQRADEDKLL